MRTFRRTAHFVSHGEAACGAESIARTVVRVSLFFPRVDIENFVGNLKGITINQTLRCVGGQHGDYDRRKDYLILPLLEPEDLRNIGRQPAPVIYPIQARGLPGVSQQSSYTSRTIVSAISTCFGMPMRRYISRASVNRPRAFSRSP